MGKSFRFDLIALALCSVLGGFLCARPAEAQKFYADDPLAAEPPPFPAVNPQARALSELLELVSHTLGRPGERHPLGGVIPAGGINTLGEVLDGPWFVNRHARRRLTPDELRQGPGAANPPADDEVWRVLFLRPSGVRPGMLIADQRGRLYLLRFDPPGYLEMSTGAEMVSSRIFHALGYHVVENYLVTFDRDRLVITEGSEIVSSAGNKRDLTPLDIDVYLRSISRTPSDRYRAVALYVAPEWQGLLGPYQVFGTRTDDPNDIVPHEHRREQRGLFVLSAWLNHTLMRAASTFDVQVEADGILRIRHFLVDFVGTLGSGYRDVKRAHEGNDEFFDGGAALRNILSFGIWTPAWMRARYPDLPSVGHFEYETFDPEQWAPREPIAPFANRLPDDEYWAAKLIMSFTDQDIRTLVSAGQYSDAKAAAWIVTCLIERRDRIGRVYFEKVLPVDNFRIDDGALEYDDLAVDYGLRPSPRDVAVRWARLNNENESLMGLRLSEPTLELPRVIREADPGEYFAAILSADDPEKDVKVYLRTGHGEPEIAGIERGWPGKVIADHSMEVDAGASRYADLSAEQQRLYEPYAIADAEAREREMTPEEHFDAQTISERTTYDAVTHAAVNSRLTDEQGNDLGTATDLIAGIERIAGHYYGRGGDQVFRLYVELAPEAVDTLERSQEFVRGHENTVWHVGYPHSFRQQGREPAMQISVSEDGEKADIDVEYRSSKSPQALFNGHLTSANSDVRAGDNLDRHNGRWSGLIGWWRGVFGSLPGGQQGPQDLPGAVTVGVPTSTPRNRPAGAPIAEVHDAVQEFLTDWLVRRDVDEALAFFSDRAYACLNVDADMEEEALDTRQAREALSELMSYAAEELGRRNSLTEAVVAVPPITPGAQLISHPYEREFIMVSGDADVAARYLCGQGAGAEPDESTYYEVLFRFRQKGAAALGLLWTQEAGTWRLVSYQVFEM